MNVSHFYDTPKPSGRFSVEKATAKDCNKYLISNLQSTWQAEKCNNIYPLQEETNP